MLRRYRRKSRQFDTRISTKSVDEMCVGSGCTWYLRFSGFHNAKENRKFYQNNVHYVILSQVIIIKYIKTSNIIELYLIYRVIIISWNNWGSRITHSRRNFHSSKLVSIDILTTFAVHKVNVSSHWFYSWRHFQPTSLYLRHFPIANRDTWVDLARVKHTCATSYNHTSLWWLGNNPLNLSVISFGARLLYYQAGLE